MTLPVSRASRWLVVLCMTALMAVSYLDRQVLGLLAPKVTETLHIGEAAYGLVAGAFSLGYLAAAPFAAKLLDRLGTRGGVALAVLTWSCIAAGHAAATGFSSLVTMRLLLGMAESPSFPASARVLRNVLPPRERARAFGLLFTGSSLGAALSAIVATRLYARFGLGATFIGTALIGALWLVPWALVSSRPDVRAALANADEHRERAPIRAVLRERAPRRLLVLAVSISPLMAFVLLWGSKFLVHRFHLSQIEAGSHLWLPPVLSDVGAVGFGFWTSARLARDRSPRPILAVASAIMCSSAFAAFAPSPGIAVAFLGLGLAGATGLATVATNEGVSRVSSRFAATIGGLVASAQSIAFVVASITIGGLVEKTSSYSTALVALSALSVPACVLWLVSSAWEEGTTHD